MAQTLVTKGFLLLATLLALVACNREAQPSVSPVGFWQGTLTTTAGGSGTQSFTAEITDETTETNAEGAEYVGVFTVGDESYNVTGIYNGYLQGEVFIFNIPLEKIQPTTSPTVFVGLMWSGTMTEDTYSGGWFFSGEGDIRSSVGEFLLERVR